MRNNKATYLEKKTSWQDNYNKAILLLLLLLLVVTPPNTTQQNKEDML